MIQRDGSERASIADRRRSSRRSSRRRRGGRCPTSGPIDENDIVAIGADLEPGTLLAAYRQGLFPMPFDRRRIALVLARPARASSRSTGSA